MMKNQYLITYCLILGLVFISIICILNNGLICISAVPDFPTKAIQTFGYLFFVALCLERAIEVALTPFRAIDGNRLDHIMNEAGKKKLDLENELKTLSQRIIAEPDATKIPALTSQSSALAQRIESAKAAHLEAIKLHDNQSNSTFLWAMSIAIIIGLIAAGSGIRVLSSLFSVDSAPAKITTHVPGSTQLIVISSNLHAASDQIAQSAKQLSNAIVIINKNMESGTITTNVLAPLQSYATNGINLIQSASSNLDASTAAFAIPSGPTVLGPLQYKMFNGLDIFLTALILAGGSEGVHKLFTFYNNALSINTPKP